MFPWAHMWVHPYTYLNKKKKKKPYKLWYFDLIIKSYYQEQISYVKTL